MTVSDLDKGLTLGDADGEERWIPSLGMEVPTFINPRVDLIPDSSMGKFIYVDYHVPFALRGTYKPEDLPEGYREAYQFKTDIDGFVICTGKTRENLPCASRATNRSRFCRNHGGALHPADKKISGKTLGHIDEERVAKMDRVQQFMQGMITVEQLSDNEVQGGFIYNNEGIAVVAAKLGPKFQAMLTKELHNRLSRFLQSKASSMLTTLVDIAENDLFEAADRIKAATWVAERTLGKTPDVIMHGEVGKAYEQIFDDNVVTTSREDYRNHVTSSRLELESGEDIIDVDVEDSDSTVDVGDQQDDRSDVLVAADNVEARKASIKEQRDRIKKAKARRFAARATGATSLDAAPWLIEYKQNGSGFKACLVPPERQTAAKLAKISATT